MEGNVPARCCTLSIFSSAYLQVACGVDSAFAWLTFILSLHPDAEYVIIEITWGGTMRQREEEVELKCSSRDLLGKNFSRSYSQMPLFLQPRMMLRLSSLLMGLVYGIVCTERDTKKPGCVPPIPNYTSGSLAFCPFKELKAAWSNPLRNSYLIIHPSQHSSRPPFPSGAAVVLGMEQRRQIDKKQDFSGIRLLFSGPVQREPSPGHGLLSLD